LKSDHASLLQAEIAGPERDWCVGLRRKAVFWETLYQYIYPARPKSVVSLSVYSILSSFNFRAVQPAVPSCCRPQDGFRQQRQTGPIGYCQPPNMFYKLLPAKASQRPTKSQGLCY